MKIQRTKNSIKGISSGIINKIVLLIIPFIVRTIFIHTLGLEYLGLNSLFASILDILNLAELGIGSAIVFHLYSAIAKNDNDEICIYVNFYKKIYKIIGILVLVFGLILLPFLNIFCNSDIPKDVNIYILYLLFLINTIIPYFLFGYRISIFNAYQENYVLSRTNTIIRILSNLMQAIFLLLGKNYYIYVIIMLLFTILENFINYLLVIKYHPNIKPKGNITSKKKKEIFTKVKALFLYRIGGVVLVSVDSIVISTFLGLTILGKYNNYYYVITALFGFFQIFNQSMLAGVGNSIATESIEKNHNDFRNINTLNSWIVTFCTVCLICLYQPFIKLWVGEENLLPNMMVILLGIYFYTWKMMEIVNLYKDAAGLWEHDKYRPITAATINLILNIILVNLIGIYGIVISTIVSIIFIIFPWSSYILFKKYFENGYIDYMRSYLYNSIITLLISLITFLICRYFDRNTLKSFILLVVICCTIPNILYILLNFYKKDFKKFIIWFKNKFLINQFK